MTYRTPQTEPEQLSELIDINVDFVAKSPYPTQRSEHGKGVADMQGTFTVPEGLPIELRQGLFAHPGTYPATIRFSNGAVQKDNKRDTHGFAVKVHDVPLETAPVDEAGRSFQDFIMLDSPIFVMGGLADYIPFNRAFMDAKVSLLGKLQLGWLLLCNLRWVKPVLRLALNRPNAPLSTNYWSTTPYQLGPHVVKYKAVPQNRTGPAPRIYGANGRRNALRKQLASGPGVFAFGVLKQTDPKTQPIEDPSVDWEDFGVAYYHLADIEIPSDQIVEAPAAMENALTYSPGHAAREHFPLGAINRARTAIYAAARAARLRAVDKEH